MADPEDKIPASSSKSEDDNLLKDLNIDDVEGLEGAQLAGGQPLPKKVELDIDDMLLEEDEEEAPPEEPEAPAPEPVGEPVPEAEAAPSEEEKPPRRKISTTKLILLILAVVLPLTIIIAPIIYIYMDKPVETTQQPAPLPMPEMLELKPFVINYQAETAKAGSGEKDAQKTEGSPTAPKETIIQIIVMVDFPDGAIAKEFKSQESAIRDGLFRYFQGLAVTDIEDVNKQPELSPALTSLVNRYLKNGQVRSVQIVSVGTV